MWMAGRSGPRSLLLNHTKPVTAQVSHFGGEQTHMLGIVGVLQAAETPVRASWGPCSWHGGKTWVTWGPVTTCCVPACESMPLMFYPVSLAVGKQCRSTVAGLKELGFLASVCDTVQVSHGLLLVLIAFRLYTKQLNSFKSVLFSRETFKCVYRLSFPLPGVVLTGRFVCVECSITEWHGENPSSATD